MMLPKLVKAHEGSESDKSCSASIISVTDFSSDEEEDDGSSTDGRFLQVGHPAVKHSLWECDPDNQRSMQPTCKE